MSQAKCFNIELVKGNIGASKLLYKRFALGNELPINDYILNRLERFVDEEYLIDDRCRMSIDKRRELVGLILKASGECGIIFDPDMIEERLFPNASLTESTGQDEPANIMDVGSAFKLEWPYISDDQEVHGSQMYPCLMMLDAFKKFVTRSFFICNGRAVTPSDISMRIFFGKLSLVEDILYSLPDKMIQLVDNGKRITVPMIQRQIRQMRDAITGMGRENAGLSYLKKADRLLQFPPPIRMDVIEALFTCNSVSPITNDVLNGWAAGTESERAKLRSYNNLFILRNFDALLKRYFGKLVAVKDDSLLCTVSFFDYDINMEAENVVRAIMEVMPLYVYETKSITKSYLEPSKFNDAIGFLKSIPYTNFSSMKVYEKDEFRNRVSIGKIGDFISGINHDPSKNMKRVFDLLFKGTDFQGSPFIERLMEHFFICKEYQMIATINALYSIYQSFYGDRSGMNLYKNMQQNKYHPSIPDYYSFMMQYMIGIYRMQFIYYRRNPKASDYEIRGYILNDQAAKLTENRLKCHICDASQSIVNEFLSVARNNLTPELKSRFGEKEIQQPSVEYGIIEPDGHNPRKSFVWFNAIPINGKLYDIVFDTTNPYILATDNVSAFKVVERLSNGRTGNPTSLSEIINEAIENGNKGNLTTDLDDIISIAYQMPVSADNSFRRIMYDDNGKFNVNNIGKLFRGALSIIGLSEANNSYFSKLPSSDAMNTWLLDKGLFPLVSNDNGHKRGSVIKLLNRPGINNISSNIGASMELILVAMAYTDKVLVRDTISFPDGTQVSAIQSNCLISSIDSQLRRIRIAAMNGEIAPAKHLMVNSTAGEFFNQLVLDGVIDESDKELMKSISMNELLFKGTYTTCLADLQTRQKKRSGFSIQESLISDYIINFLNNVYGNSLYMDKDIIFNAQINADKGQVTYEAVNGNFIRNLAKMNEDKRMNILKNAFKHLYTDIYRSISDTYERMDMSMIRMANPQMRELYDYALSVDESAMMDSYMQVYASNPNYIDAGLFNHTVHDNFEAFNSLCDLANVDAYEMAMLLSKVHNVLNPNDRIEFVDQTHFLKVEGTKHIQFNPLLVSKIIRFSPTMSSAFDLTKFTMNPNFFNTFGQFYEAKNNELFYSMIDSGIDISISNANGRDNGFSGLKALKRANPAWFKGGRMIFGKLHSEGKPRIDITSEYDIIVFLEKAIAETHIGNSYAVNNALRSSENLYEMLDKMDYTVEINPELIKFNWIDYFVGQSYEISSVGDNFNHPVKGNFANDMELDAFATYIQFKRKVSQITTIKPWIVDHLNSVPRVISVASVEDIPNSVPPFSGIFKKISLHDSISFMSPTAVYLFNNGLMNSCVGFDMKPFFHDYNISTSTGVIIKTSTDALTNQTIRQGKNMKNMAKKMMDARWLDKNGKPVNGNIFKDYGFRLFDNKGNKIDLFAYISNKYHPMVELSRGNVYEIVDIQQDGNNADGTPLYKRTMKRVDRFGDYNEESETIVDEEGIRVGSNYDLWNLLGGENSREKYPATGLVTDSENSIKAVVDIINNNGVSHNNESIDVNQSRTIESQADVYQFMKHGNADIVASHSAMEQGYTNVNRYQDFYFNKKGLLNTMKFDLTHSGVMLDPMHKADNSNISEFAQ
ncbi:hypothetical protein [Bacteroides sp.]|uniref:hypothetical protein n=1 Tax=Bacteroides sp. TaxID=29523 RepID=UPI003AB741B0